MRKIGLICLLALVANSVGAAVNSTTTTIDQIYSYAVAGGGDALVVLKTNPTGCNGFWLDSADPGFNQNLSVVLSAYHAGSQVIFYGNETQTFPGSSQNFCKAATIRLMPP